MFAVMCKWFESDGQEANIKLVAKELVHLQGAGLQKCLSFSVDGSRFASGGVDGHLRIFEWPTLRIILDEPRAHNSFQDMDFSLDSEFLATTSTDGSARIWKTNDGVPLTSLTRNSDEKIELCRFSKDGTKPFLFCTIQKANRAVTAVWDMSTWNRIGHKRLLKKPASIMSISLDGKYLALGLRGNSLTGTLSPDMCQLIGLWYFDERGNNLTGTIPDNIGNCTSFEILEISYNQISGQIPYNIGFLQVATLSLQGNRLTGKIPEVIGLMQALAVLKLQKRPKKRLLSM